MILVPAALPVSLVSSTYFAWLFAGETLLTIERFELMPSLDRLLDFRIGLNLVVLEAPSLIRIS